MRSHKRFLPTLAAAVLIMLQLSSCGVSQTNPAANTKNVSEKPVAGNQNLNVQPVNLNASPQPAKNADTGRNGISLADIVTAQEIFASADKAYQKKSATPAIKESETDASRAKNLALIQQSLKHDLTPAEKEFLSKNKFVLLDLFDHRDQFCFSNGLLEKDAPCDNGLIQTPENMVAQFQEFGGVTIDLERNQSNAVYVNSDIILHTYHVFIDRYFKRLEQKQLYPLLVSIVGKLRESTKAAMKASGSSTDYERILGYLTLGEVLLKTRAADKPAYFSDPAEEETWTKQDQEIDKNIDSFYKNLESYKSDFQPGTYQKIKDELQLIFEAKTAVPSPLFGLYRPGVSNDYTQFTPRSHYNENSLLRAYFRTMMLFGRQTFYFKSKEGLNDSLLLTSMMQKSGVVSDWKKLSDVTDFFAGKADDITYVQFSDALKKELGKDFSYPVSGLDMSKVQQAITALPVPKILSEVVVDDKMSEMTKADLLNASKGLRLFGQKFTFDAWALNRLTAGQEKTEVPLPSTPSALFVAGALGSDLVKSFLPAWIKQQGDQLQPDTLWNEILKVRKDFDTVETDTWLSSIGSSWLWTLQPLLQNYGKGYPQFMQNMLYQTKNLQTVLGSYTELKHDTLLYAKQSYAELGAGEPEGTPPEIVKGFVDPDIEFWNRIIALSTITRDGLKERGMLEDTVDQRFDDYLENLEFYRDFAQKELKNEKISDDEYEDLRTNFWKVAELIAPFEGELIQEKDKKPALIADIHTDAVKGQILYEATGNPLIMLAFVSDQNTPRLVVGLAYRHFELAAPIGKRTTDEEWKTRVDNKDLPATPFFYEGLMAK